MTFSTSNAGDVGRSSSLTVCATALSSFSMQLSTRRRASVVSLRPSIVELVSTLTFASGKYLSRSAMVSSIIPGKSGLTVGSPLPEKVITSIVVPSSLSCSSRSSSSWATSARRGSPVVPGPCAL